MKTKRIKALFIATIFAFESMLVGYAPVSAQSVSENTVVSVSDNTISDIETEEEIKGDKAKQNIAIGSQTEEVSAEKATIKYNGTDGDLTWSIDSVGILKVSGSGDYEGSYIEVTECASATMPNWIQYREAIKKAKINVSGIKNMAYFFCGCKNLTDVDMSESDTSMVTHMNRMFGRCEALESLDLSNVNTSNVIDMEGMFYSCISLKQLDISGFDTKQVTNMTCMFNGCESIEYLDLSHFNTGKVTGMGNMFAVCNELQFLDVSKFNTSQVTNMSAMFNGCSAELDLSNFDTGNVTDMTDMFSCSNRVELDISSFDLSNVTEMNQIFYANGCLKTLKAPENTSSQTMELPNRNTWVFKTTGKTVTEVTKAGVYESSYTITPEEKGTKLTDYNSQGRYTVVNDQSKTPTVEYVAPTDKTKTKVVIPQYVTYKGVKYKVTSVAAKAFKGNKKLKNISIATSITKIGNDAFNGCTNLKTVTIGKSLKTIGKNAFKNCKKLTKITIKSKRLKSVGKNALKGVNKKCKIKVPAAKVSAYKKLFKNKGLKKVKVTK